MNSQPVQDEDTVLHRKRDQIVETAFHLFAKQGYHNTTIRQIAQNAGVLPSSVYSYFCSKDALYQSVLEQYHPWLAVHSNLTVRYASGVMVETFDFLQFLATEWVKDPDGVRLHLVELLEFQGKHIVMLYNRLRGMIASFLSSPSTMNRSVDQAVEQLSESAVAVFYILLFDQCLAQITGKTDSKFLGWQ